MHIFASIAGLLIATAHAQITDAATGVAGGLIGGPGSFEGIITLIRSAVWPIMATGASFFVIRAGLKLINSQDEGKLETAKRTIASALVGLMLAPLGDRILFAVFNPSGQGLGNPSTLTFEIGGIIDWTLVLIIPIAILMIVLSAIRAVASFGKEDGADMVRQTVYGVVLGLGILIFAGAIKATLGLQESLDDVSPATPGPPEALAIVTRGVEVVTGVLQFMALVALAIIIYAGMIMILNFGNDEQFTRAKGIVYRAVIGLVIILLSTVLITFIVNVVLSGVTSR